MRVFADTTFLEVFFQQGRVAMTVGNVMENQVDYVLTAEDVDVVVKEATVWPIGSPWVTEEEVRNSPRVYK